MSSQGKLILQYQDVESWGKHSRSLVTSTERNFGTTGKLVLPVNIVFYWLFTHFLIWIFWKQRWSLCHAFLNTKSLFYWLYVSLDIVTCNNYYLAWVPSCTFFFIIRSNCIYMYFWFLYRKLMKAPIICSVSKITGWPFDDFKEEILQKHCVVTTQNLTFHLLIGSQCG